MWAAVARSPHGSLERRTVSHQRFLLITGAIIVVLLGMLVAQRLRACEEQGGKFCCFGRNFSGNPACTPPVIRPQ